MRKMDDLRRELRDIRDGKITAIDDRESATDIWAFGIPFMVRSVCLAAFEFGMPYARATASRESLMVTCQSIVAEITRDLALYPFSAVPLDVS
jgi:hypothetical protein